VKRIRAKKDISLNEMLPLLLLLVRETIDCAEGWPSVLLQQGRGQAVGHGALAA
jgi:hypothetical protein